LEEDINNDIGLSWTYCLSPALKIGMTVEYFSLHGKEPNSRDLLKMYIKCMTTSLYPYILLSEACAVYFSMLYWRL